MPRAEQSLRSYSLPAPTAGIDGLSSLFLMPETKAIDIINGICDAEGIRTRGGETEFLDISSGFTFNTGAVGELVGTDGSADPFLMQDDDFLEANSATSRKGTLTITDENWYWTQFKYRIFAVNGVDQPFDWTGDGNNATATAWTGTGLTIADLWNVSTFKGELVFLEKGAFGWWVPTTAVGAITGAMTFYDIQEYSRKGGQLAAVGSLSSGTDNYISQYLCFFSDQGELFVYEGISPRTVTLLGRYELAPPMGDGRDSFLFVDGDIFIITIDGLVSAQQLIRGAPREQYVLSQPFERQWLDAASDYSATNWISVWNPRQKYVLIYNTNGSAVQVFFCYNLSTRGWSRLENTLIESWYYSTVSNKLIIAPVVGQKLLSYDDRDVIGGDQLSVAKNITIRHAFSPLGIDRNLKKSIIKVKPYFKLVGGASFEPNGDQIQIDANYESEVVSVAKNRFSLDLPFTNGTTYFSERKKAGGAGEVISLVIYVNFSTANYGNFVYYGSSIEFREDGIA